jgi:hypothetical protein
LVPAQLPVQELLALVLLLPQAQAQVQVLLVQSTPVTLELGL